MKRSRIERGACRTRQSYRNTATGWHKARAKRVCASHMAPTKPAGHRVVAAYRLKCDFWLSYDFRGIHS